MRYPICLTALCLISANADAADCSLGLGATVAGRGDTEIVSLGCNVRSFEMALHHVGQRAVTASEPTAGTTNLFRRSAADGHAAISIAKIWRFQVRGVWLHFGAGLWLKKDERYWRDAVRLPCRRDHDRPHLVSYAVVDTYCENQWVPSPVSFYLPVGLEWRSWQLRYAHVSNGDTATLNEGQDSLHLGYRWRL